MKKLFTIPQKYKQLFQQLSLSDTEMQLYLLLVKHKAISLKKISKLLNLSPSTIHDNLQRLCQKKLIIRKGRGKSTLYEAQNPDNLEFLIQNQIQEISLKNQKIQQLQDSFPDLHQFITQHAKITYFSGKDEALQMYRNLLESNQTIRTFVDLERYFDIFSDEMKQLNAIAKNPTVYEIALDTKKNRAYSQSITANQNPNYETKFVSSRSVSFNADILISRKHVILVELADENLITGVDITSPAIIQAFILFHTQLWQRI